MIRAVCIVLAAGVILTNSAFAGKYNKKLSLGDPAPAWTNLPGADGKAHSLADIKDKEIVVVVFTCNNCPVAQEYEARIVAFAKKFTGADGKVALVAINVNTNDDDSLPQMKKHAKEKGFTFPYLYDESQKIGHAYGATVTPEFFVLNKERKIVYMGKMDDDMNNPKENYLNPAVEATLKGNKPATQETRPFGCAVQYDKTK